MARTSAIVAAVVAALLVALLVVCVGLLSAIFVKQKDQAQPPTTAPVTPAPGPFKDVIVLVDSSSGVDDALLGKEADFFANQLRESFASKTGTYAVRVAASAIASGLSSPLSFVDAADKTAVTALADTVRQSNSDKPLDLGAVLTSLVAKRRASAQGEYTLVVLASGQGINYANAVLQAAVLKLEGVAVVAISLKANQDLSKFASEGAALDGQVIASGNAQQLTELANRVTAIVDKQPPIPTTVPVTTTTPSTDTTSKPSPTTPSPTSPSTPSPTTTPPKPLNTRVIVLVDASAGVTQQQMIKQASFVSTELIDAFMYPSTHGSDTGMLLVPFAFDTSPDNSDFIRLDSSDQTLAIANQAMNTKLARITTFIEPLDALQMGQALYELDSQMQASDSQKKPTHVVLLTSGKGTDFTKALSMAKSLMGKHVGIIPVATVGAATDLSELASDSSCVLDGHDILNGQNLNAMASSIAKCIYPTAAMPQPKRKQLVVRPHPTSPPPQPKTLQLPKPFVPNTANQIVVLVDTSANVDKDLITKQTTFIKQQLVPALKTAFPVAPTIALVPYAFFTGAVAEKFAALTDDTLLDAQIRTVAVSKITTFMPPLDVYELAQSFKVLTGSFFVNSTNAKIILIANDADPTTQLTQAAISNANALTDGGKKALVVVSLTGKQQVYVEKLLVKSTRALDGKPISSGSATQQLATDVANALKNPAKLAMVHVPRHTE